MPSLSFYENVLFSPTPEANATSEIQALGAPSEMVSLSFFVSSSKGLDDVEISFPGLSHTSTSAQIAADSLDVHVVKVWEQGGIGIFRTDPVQVPELLLKDDRVPFDDHYSRRCAHWKSPKHWRHALRPPKFYCPPPVRLEGPANTELKAGEQKQIWLTVKIPPDATAGTYAGHVHFRSKSGAIEEKLAVHLEVLPIRLLQPEQDLCLWYRGALDCLFPQHHVSEHIFEAQLRDIYEHGFTSFSLNESKTHLLQKAIDIAHCIGFRHNVVLMAPWPADVESIDFKGLTPVYYISDEADTRGKEFVQAHHDNWQKIKERGGATMSSILYEARAKEVFKTEDESRMPDIYALYLPNNLHYFAIRSEFASVQAKNVYYYWLSHMEKPNVHRVLAGLFLWKSKAQGIVPYSYQHLPGLGSTPFDDFADAENEVPDVGEAGNDKPRKVLMTTYPAATGSIPTLQWKGISSGITDLKYLVTLSAALEEAENLKDPSPELQTLIQEIRERVERFLARVSLTRIEIRLITQPEPYLGVEPDEYQEFREQMARDIVSLQNALGATPSKVSR